MRLSTKLYEEKPCELNNPMPKLKQKPHQKPKETARETPFLTSKKNVERKKFC